MLLQEMFVIYIVVLQELERRGRTLSHIFSIQPVRSVIRSTQRGLLPVEGRACLQLLFDSAAQTYDLETLLLLYSKIEHTFTVYGKKREDSGIIPRPRNAFLGDAWNSTDVWYSIQRSGSKRGADTVLRLLSRILQLLFPRRHLRQHDTAGRCSVV